MRDLARAIVAAIAADPDALAALRAVVVADRVAAPRPYSQLEGERPPGCGRARYLRVWRRARDARDPGATADGRARLLTVDAYERHRTAVRARPALRVVGDDLLDEIGGAA